MPDDSPSSNSIPVARLTEALADVLREELMQNNTVRVPGLGTFQVQHQLSQIKEKEDGDVVMTPPKDAITFKAEES